MGRFIIFIIGILLLVPWPVVYAYESGAAVSPPVRIEAVASAERPGWHAFGKTISSVTPGALFYIDCRQNPADTAVNLSLVNPDELVHHYRYLNLVVALYIKNEVEAWERVGGDYYLTLKSGDVSLRLPADAEYKLNVDGGSFYYFGSARAEGTPAPRFYLTVR